MNTELSRLTIGKMILPFVPARLRQRIAAAIYNHRSKAIKGIDIVVECPGYKLMVNTKDLIGWNMFFFSEYERSTNNVLKQFVHSGDVVIEAGANIGTETLLLSNIVGDKGRIYAFEPNKDVFDRLNCNVHFVNKSRNIECKELALGEENGIIHFNVYPDNFYNSGMSSKYHGATDVVDVQQVTLDSFIDSEHIDRIDFIKMDVQGAELDVLTGAQKTLERYRPCIFLEADEHQAELFESLSRSGYLVNVIRETRLEPLQKATAEWTNWLAIPKERAA